MHSSRVSGELGIGDLIVSFVGWIGDPDLPEGVIWPEPWPPRIDAPEDVGVITRDLKLTQEEYLAASDQAKELVEKEPFKRAVNLVARGLMIAPLLDYEGLEILRETAGFTQELEGAAA